MLDTAVMDLDQAKQQWQNDGYAILPGLLTTAELAPTLSELERVFPSAEGFHDETDPRRTRFIGDEFDGIDRFPFASVPMNLLTVNDRLVRLAEHLLETDDLRVYSAEAWAKYTGACDYDQGLHRDYLNHTMVVPSDDPAYRQLEYFIYLVDVPEGLGPPHLVSQQHTRHLPFTPNFFPRTPVDTPDRFVSSTPVPALYAAEVSGTGPAGTVIAFQPSTFHRGTNLTMPRGARFSMQVTYRPAALEWGQRYAWTHHTHERDWYRLVPHATPRQLALFGFPPPGHPYWTPTTLAGVSARYPDLDLTPWRSPRTAD